MVFHLLLLGNKPKELENMESCFLFFVLITQSKTQVSQPLVFMLKLGELIWKKENKNEP